MSDSPRLRVALRRVEAGLVHDGGQWPALRAAIVVARARLGLDRNRFATRLGLRADGARDLEAGGWPPALAPPLLADLVPEIDWSALGVPQTQAARDPDRARHPSAHRPGRGRDP